MTQPQPGQPQPEQSQPRQPQQPMPAQQAATRQPQPAQPAYAQPMQPQPTPPAQPVQPTQPKRSNIQTLLLVLGVALVVIAVFAFAWFAYGLLGDIGRAACVGVVGIVAVGVAIALTTRLRVTSEGLAWAGFTALVIGAMLVDSLDESHLPAKATSLISGVLLLAVSAAALGIRLVPLRNGLPPLRVYSLFIVFSLPLATMTTTAALPIDDNDALVTSVFNAGAFTAIAIAGLFPADPRRRVPDFERICAMIVATVLQTFATVELYMTVDYGPIWLAACLVALTTTGWVLVLVVSYMRRLSRSGKRLPSGLRFVPVSAVIWVMASTTTLLMRVLPDAMPVEMQRMCAYLPTIVVSTVALVAGCVIPRRVAAVRTVERIAAALNGSFVLLIMVCSEFGREGIAPLVTSMAAFAGLLAAAVCTWAIAATPTEKPVRVPVAPRRPQSRFQPAYPQTYPQAYPPSGPTAHPQPYQPFQPQAQVMQTVQPQQPMQAQPQPYPTQAQPLPHSAVVDTPMPGTSGTHEAPGASGGIPSQPWRPYPPAPSPMPAKPPHASPARPEEPRSASSATVMALKALGPDAAGIIATVFASLATVILFLMAIITKRPYAPADLICGAVGVAALVVGIQWLRLWPRLRSWPALWPALTLLMVPSLIASWLEEPRFPRMIALFALALCALLLGAIKSLQAPLIYGTVVLVAHVLTVIWPWLAEFSRQFWWVWLALGGVILIIAAARYEASLTSMRTLASRISDLR